MDQLRPFALLLLRCALGVIFFYHGFSKLTHLHLWATQYFPHMGFPGYFAYISAVLETCGGVLLVLGLLTRPIALLLAGELLIALLKVHLPSGPITHVGGYELPMLLSAAAFAVFASGPGLLSADSLVFGRKPNRKLV